MRTPENISQSEKKRLAADFEKERDKIVVSNKSSQIPEEKKQEISRFIEHEEASRKRQLKQAFRGEAGFARLIFRLKGFLTRVPAEELYQESLLQELRSKILRSSRNVLASGNKISGKFVASLYRAYLEASSFFDILNVVFKQQKTTELYVRYAFRHLFRDIDMKRELSDLLDLTELGNKIEDIQVHSGEGKEELEECLVEKRAEIRRYVRELSPIFIGEVSKSLNKLYHLYLFTTFDYKKFLITLGGTTKSLKGGHFEDTPLTVSMKGPLENFYQYVPAFVGLWGSAEDPVRYILACATIAVNKDPDESFENIDMIASRDKPSYMKKLGNFSKKWTANIYNYPLYDLIRLVSLNPFYELKLRELATLNVKLRIRKFVEQQLLYELELFVGDIQEKFNFEAKQQLLIDYHENSMLEYYSEKSVMNTGRFYGIPGFAYTTPLNMLYNFVTKYYAKNIKKVFVHLVRSVLPKNSNLRSTILSQSVTIDNLEERIRKFNTELNPESSWGKSLMNITYRLEKNDTGNLMKQIKEQLKGIDAEAADILNHGLSLLESTMKQLQSLVASENVKMKDALKNSPIADMKVSCFVAIEEAVYALSSISNLIRSYYR